MRFILNRAVGENYTVCFVGWRRHDQLYTLVLILHHPRDRNSAHRNPPNKSPIPSKVVSNQSDTTGEQSPTLLLVVRCSDRCWLHGSPLLPRYARLAWRYKVHICNTLFFIFAGLFIDRSYRITQTGVCDALPYGMGGFYICQ